MELDRFDWHSYWGKQENGGHRIKEEEFFKKAAGEILYHLGGGGTMLDFGCGSGELMVYFANKFKGIIGADFSGPMLERARARIEDFNLQNVRFVNADDKTVWEKIVEKVDVVFAYGVIQYMRMKEIDKFLRMAAERIDSGGRIALFNIIDPARFLLWKSGYFNKDNATNLVILKSALRFLALLLKKTVKDLRRLPLDDIGYGYHPKYFSKISADLKMKGQCVSSLYYEYRYHYIMIKD